MKDLNMEILITGQMVLSKVSQSTLLLQNITITTDACISYFVACMDNVVIQKPIIALAKDSVSVNGRYQMILHPEILCQEERILIFNITLPTGVRLKMLQKDSRNPFVRQKGDIHYIGGCEVLPPPLEIEEESRMLELLETEVFDKYKYDANRFYVMGLSMGGQATWKVTEKYASKVAAAVPICGSRINDNTFEDATKMKDVPIWMYHGTADQTIPFSDSETRYNNLIAAGAENVTFTILEGYDHNVWDYAAADAQMIKWLFNQKKS